MARDDTIVPAESLLPEHLESAPSVEVLWTDHGGHVGFVCAGCPGWLEAQVLEWFDEHLGASTR